MMHTKLPEPTPPRTIMDRRGWVFYVIAGVLAGLQLVQILLGAWPAAVLGLVLASAVAATPWLARTWYRLGHQAGQDAGYVAGYTAGWNDRSQVH